MWNVLTKTLAFVSDCESCENLVFLIKQESDKTELQTKEKEDIVAKMAKEIVELKKENKSLAQEVE